MRLLILSDLHREVWCQPRTWAVGDEARDPFARIDLSISRPDVVVLAGDIDLNTRGVGWAHEAFPSLPVIYVHGNHEGYGHNMDTVVQEITLASQATGHVHHLNCGELIIDGIRFLGTTLWTDFQLYGPDAGGRAMDVAANQMNDYRRIRLACDDYRRLSPVDTVRWHGMERDWLLARLDEPFEGKTVVVTHMAPSERSIEEKYKGDELSPAFASNLDSLVERADLWIHGHVHHVLNYRVGERGRVVCNPLGYPRRGAYGVAESEGFDANFVIEL